MAEKTKNIVIVDDRFLLRVGRQVVTFSVLLAVVGIGVFLESSALQWVGAVLWILFLIGKVIKMDNESTMTISEAREYLDKLEAKP